MLRLGNLSNLKTPRLQKKMVIVAANLEVWSTVSLHFSWAWHEKKWRKIPKTAFWGVHVWKNQWQPMVGHPFQHVDKPLQVSHAPCTMNDRHLQSMIAKQSRLHLRLGSVAAAFK